MSDFTPNLGLAYIASSQAQKHITVNENSRSIDAQLSLSLRSINTITPPSNPANGDSYFVPADATGAWVGNTGKIAVFLDGDWMFYEIPIGKKTWINDSKQSAVLVKEFLWMPVQSVTDNGAFSYPIAIEEEISLSGSFQTTNIAIPARSILFCVTSFTTSDISGTSSYSIGVSGENDKFGNFLGIASGSNNKGIIGPTAYYNDTPVIISANGGNFTGGSVLITIHAFEFSLPQV